MCNGYGIDANHVTQTTSQVESSQGYNEGRNLKRLNRTPSQTKSCAHQQYERDDDKGESGSFDQTRHDHRG